jgi:YfiH family protein
MNDLPFIVPNWPAPTNVKALQTTRNGGLSLSPYASLNLGGHVNDDPLAVAANRQLLSPFLPSEPVWVNQVHGTRVIDAAKSGCLEDADASFANIANVVCVTMTADCLPVLLCDRSGSVVAAVHAGWRGLCDGIIEAAITSMAVQTQDILAWLGPAIGPQAFEVGPEVRQQFIEKGAEAEIAFSAVGNKWLCDIYAIAQQRLRKTGVSQIYGGGINENFCTYTDKARFFSYRRDQITGRMASLIWLQPA